MEPAPLPFQGTLQKFVDDTFQAILSVNRPVPIAVKYLFDFLDELAEKHGIEDPETLHIWKTNRYRADGREQSQPMASQRDKDMAMMRAVGPEQEARLDFWPPPSMDSRDRSPGSPGPGPGWCGVLG